MSGESMTTQESGDKGTRTVEGICGICPGGCGVRIELVDGRIDQVKPLKNHPLGVVCVRGVHSKDVVYSEERLRYPLRRVGKRGSGALERVSWDEALDDITARMQELKAKHGPESMGIYSGRGMFEMSFNEAFAPPGAMTRSATTLLAAFGSPNTAGVSSLCNVSYSVLAHVPTLGLDARSIDADLQRARLIVVWGANPATDSPPEAMREMVRAKSRGARIVVIDPRRSEIAEKADQWVPVRSGTDGALALSMLYVVINEGLFDRDFVERWTVGFEDLRAYVQGFPPEEGERITGVPRETIVALARAVATRHAALHMYTGLEYTNSGVQNIRATLVLWAITGNLDVPGGLLVRSKLRGKFGRVTVEPARDAKAIGSDRYPLFCDLVKAAQFMEAPRAILHDDPYPLRGLIVAGASILTSYPNPDLWRQCLSSLDLLVVVDRFLTGDAMYADYVLPATTYYENLAYQRHPSGYVQLRQPIIAPIGEARSDYSIFRALAERLGYGSLYPPDEESLIDQVFRSSPVAVEELRKNPAGLPLEVEPVVYRKWETGGLRPDGKPGFPTPTGKFEIASSMLSKHGYPALPEYVEPQEGPLGSPEVARQFPLVLNTGARTQSAFRSQHLNIPGLLRLQPEPEVWLHPLDAAARGIVDGDKVDITSPRGSVRLVARVSDRVGPGQVEANMGGGNPNQSAAWRDANVNVLTDMDNRDPISGFPVLKALLCEVRKADPRD